MTPDRRSDPACWHYRDARGRACGPYDAGALARLYRFGHLRADSDVWCDADGTPPAPLRSRRDAFRLHRDGRLEALPTTPAQAPLAAAAGASAESPGHEAGPVPTGPAAGPEPPSRSPSPTPPTAVTARPPRVWAWAAAALLVLGLTLLAARLAS